MHLRQNKISAKELIYKLDQARIEYMAPASMVGGAMTKLQNQMAEMIGVKVDEERKPEEEKKKKNVIAMVSKLMEKGNDESRSKSSSGEPLKRGSRIFHAAVRGHMAAASMGRRRGPRSAHGLDGRARKGADQAVRHLRAQRAQFD